MKKILIVEDESSPRLMMKKLINDIGYVDIIADSGELAVDILKVNKDIDLIITDVVMEGMNGIELVEKVRSMKNYSDVPVIVVSGFISKDEIIAYLNLGINLFLEKPINGKRLQAHVLKILEPVLEETNFK